MRQLLSQGQRLLTPLHGLGRIPKTPQRKGRKGKTPHFRYHIMIALQSPLRRRSGEGDRVLQVRPGGRVLAQEEQRAAERVMGLQAGRRCGLALCQPYELFPELTRRLQRPPRYIEPTETAERR